MSKNEETVTLGSLIPTDRKWLMDDEKKVGAEIAFSKEELKELSKFVDSRLWEILQKVYVKQRLVQIAVANLNASQSDNELMFYKGKAAESNHLFKVIRGAVNDFNKEEKERNKHNKTE